MCKVSLPREPYFQNSGGRGRGGGGGVQKDPPHKNHGEKYPIRNMVKYVSSNQYHKNKK